MIIVIYRTLIDYGMSGSNIINLMLYLIKENSVLIYKENQ